MQLPSYYSGDIRRWAERQDGHAKAMVLEALEAAQAHECRAVAYRDYLSKYISPAALAEIDKNLEIQHD